MKDKSLFIFVTILQIIVCFLTWRLFMRYPNAGFYGMVGVYLYMTTLLGYLRFKN